MMTFGVCYSWQGCSRTSPLWLISHRGPMCDVISAMAHPYSNQYCPVYGPLNSNEHSMLQNLLAMSLYILIKTVS